MSYSEDTIDFLHQGDLIGMQNSLAKALKMIIVKCWLT